MRSPGAKLTSWLETAPKWAFVLYAMTAAFATYFCMYAFRKPFAAGHFEGQYFLGGDIGLKTAFVVSQLLGYTASKYIGIKVCPEVRPGRRAGMLVLLILSAELALVGFAVLPRDLKVAAIFLNGLPLGMVWGLVVWYLEGRMTSELLLAALACSYIVSSGAVKDVGRYLISAFGVSEPVMPMLTGLLFLPVFLFSVWLLSRLPPPTPSDQAARARRSTMDGTSKIVFFRTLFLGLVLLLVARLLTTAFRDFRDNYGVEIFGALGYHDDPTLFTRAEVPVAFGVMLSLALLNLVRSNRAGVVGAHIIMMAGLVLMGVSTLLLDLKLLSGLAWMILVGLGSYMAYVPHDSVVFDRIIASTRVPGTAVFAIYLADATGYTASIGLPLLKDLAFSGMDRLAFFRIFTYIVSLGGIGVLVGSSIYFYTKHKPVSENAMSADDPVDFVIKLFKAKGDAAYIGEPVSQTEHALQAAWSAEQAGANSALIAAAFLHDVGHLLHDLPEDCAHHGIDDAHEVRGARWLERHFRPEVTEPVRLHVPAKRFLCSTDPEYMKQLSEASVLSLKLQGGPYTQEEVAKFRQNPFAEAAVTLRRYDEEAKIKDLVTPDLEHFRPYLEAGRAARQS